MNTNPETLQQVNSGKKKGGLQETKHLIDGEVR